MTWFGKLGKWVKKTGDKLGDYIADALGLPGTVAQALKSVGSNLASKYGETGLTDREKESADLQLQNQQQLNEEEYDRKIDFYERFESPEAQVRQYKSAGLNPALMFGNGASVSASGGVGSSGSAASPDTSAASGPNALLELIMGLKQFKLQREQVRSEILEREARTSAQRIENKWNERLKELQAREIEQRIALEGSQFSLNQQTLQKLVHETTYAQTMALFAPQLFESQVHERQASAYHHQILGEVGEKQKEQIDSIVAKNKAETEKINEEIAQVQQYVQTLASQENLNNARADEARQNIRESIQRIKKIGKEIGLLGNDLKYYIWNHAKQVGIGPIKFPMVNPSGVSSSSSVSSDGDFDMWDMVD